LDLQKDLCQVHAGQPHRHVATQFDQAGRLVQLVQGRECHDVASTAAVDRHGGIARQVVGSPPVGFVELSAEAFQFFGRRG
jgi:hypothetical protein